MIINLIKPKEMFSLTLPKKVKGKYWISDTDERGRPRDLISIEAVGDDWVVKSNKHAKIFDETGAFAAETVIKPLSFIGLRIAGSDDRVILFAESVDDSRLTFEKFVAAAPGELTIGRQRENNFCYENKYVSGRHAFLTYNGNTWSITDTNSMNGTYVNGRRVSSAALSAGDVIYIMGLKIIIGHNYLAVNDPDGLLHINTGSLYAYRPQPVNADAADYELPEKNYFFRSPRFHREVTHAVIKIDPPPQLQKLDTVPLALMLGPSITMAMTSVSTGLITVSNVLSNGGNISQAMPTLIMSVGMLLGTVLWPILTKKYEKSQKIKNERRRQEKYLGYLDGIRDEIGRRCNEQSEILRENVISAEECSRRIVSRDPKLWERAPGQSDFLRLRLGVGSLPMDAEVTYSEKKFSMDDDSLQDAMLSLGTEPKKLDNVPVSISLVEDRTVGIYGPTDGTVNLLKSLILQMTARQVEDTAKA